MKICDFIIKFACPNCEINFSKGVYGGDSLEIEDLYEDHVKQFMMGECYRCHAAEIGVQSIVGRMKPVERRKLFQITWSCGMCNKSWIQKKYLTFEEVKDKDLIIKIREQTECPNPKCDKSVKTYQVLGINVIDD